MRHPLQRQVESLRQEFLQDGQLPFTDVLTEDGLTEALREIEAPWSDRIFTPLVTLWVFLGQVLAADPSCRAAVARLIAHRVARGLKPCSSETGAYCQAREGKRGRSWEGKRGRGRQTGTQLVLPSRPSGRQTGTGKANGDAASSSVPTV